MWSLGKFFTSYSDNVELMEHHHDWFFLKSKKCGLAQKWCFPNWIKPWTGSHKCKNSTLCVAAFRSSFENNKIKVVILNSPVEVWNYTSPVEGTWSVAFYQESFILTLLPLEQNKTKIETPKSFICTFRQAQYRHDSARFHTKIIRFSARWMNTFPHCQYWPGVAPTWQSKEISH